MKFNYNIIHTKFRIDFKVQAKDTYRLCDKLEYEIKCEANEEKLE